MKRAVFVRVLPYHNYAGSKYAALGITSTLPHRLPTNDEVAAAREVIATVTGFTVL